MGIYYGFNILVRMWISNYRSIIFKPKSVSLLSSLNPFTSPVFYDTVRKVLKHCGLRFGKYIGSSVKYQYAYFPIDTKTNIIFDWKDRSQVLTTLNEIFRDKQYGNPPCGRTIDVGANIGVYSLYACKTSKVLAIEPFKKNLDFLFLNSLGKNIFPINYAIGKSNGKRKLFLSEVTAGCTFQENNVSSNYVYVDTIRLDDLMCDIGLHVIDTLKIDVEGSEMEVLESAGNFLHPSIIKQVIVASYHYPSEAEEVSNLLLSHGYKVKKSYSTEVVVFGF